MTTCYCLKPFPSVKTTAAVFCVSLFFTVKKESFLVSSGRRQVGIDDYPPGRAVGQGDPQLVSGTFSSMFREGSRFPFRNSFRATPVHDS